MGKMARMRRLFALIDADIIDFVTKRESGIVDGSTIIASER